MNTDTHSPWAVQRLRHPLKLRRARVQQVERISPHFVRIRLASESLHDFVSASFDDHVKLMLPGAPGRALVLPHLGPDGAVPPPEADRPAMRDYTPRHVDNAAGLLDIELALHGDGVAAQWAAQAQPGQEVGLGGPRGSFVVPTAFDWHLLVGDETALPAIARRLEELPSGVQAMAVIETADPADRRKLSSPAQLQTHWLQSGEPEGLAQAVRQLALPPGEGFAWAAGEASSVVAVREVLLGIHGLDKSRVRASAYWKRGKADHHETL